LLSAEDIKAINSLVREKYSTWFWNFGYSPAYILETELYLHTQIIPARIFVKNGIINNIELQDETFAGTDFFKNLLIGHNHEYESIYSLFYNNKDYMLENGIDIKKLITSMF